jgi:hypothetical protein
MDLSSREGKQAQERFRHEVEALKGPDLLKAKLAFDKLPPPSPDEAQFHLYQSLTFEAALIGEYGRNQYETYKQENN